MEELCEKRRALGAIVAVVRPFTVAGEGQRSDMAFSIWLEALRRGDPIRILGSENRSRDITDVRDVVEGLIRAGERQVNTTVNLGTGVGHRLIDMAQALLAVTGRDGEVVVQPASTDEVAATLADTTRCGQLLGFVPETDLHDVLGRQVDATAGVVLPALA
jgi:nucleoside-diphosphate-sugar epimerase